MLGSKSGFSGFMSFLSGGMILFFALTGWSQGRQSDPVEQRKENATSGQHEAQDDDEKINGQQSLTHTATTVAEARIRAKILHEAFSGALQVMHRDYFREDERLKLPSKSLEDVFAELAKTHQVQLRWLAVNADAMSVDHQPKDEFDHKAVKILSSGKDEFELSEEKIFRFAGAIPLSASCVKCHVRNRTSNAERKAALVITMPLGKKK